MSFGERCAAEFWLKFSRDVSLPHRIAQAWAVCIVNDPVMLIAELGTGVSYVKGVFGTRLNLSDSLLRDMAMDYLRGRYHDDQTNVFYDYFDRKCGDLVKEKSYRQRIVPRYSPAETATKYLTHHESKKILYQACRLYDLLVKFPPSEEISASIGGIVSKSELSKFDFSQLSTTTLADLAMSFFQPIARNLSAANYDHDRDCLEVSNAIPHCFCECRKLLVNKAVELVKETFASNLTSLTELEQTRTQALRLKCISIDQRSRRINLIPVLDEEPNKQGSDSGAKSVVRSHESRLLRASCIWVRTNGIIDVDDNGVIQTGRIEADQQLDFLRQLDGFISQERLATSALMACKSLNRLPEHLRLPNLELLSVQQQIRGSACGDLELVRQAGICGNAKGSKVDREQVHLLLQHYKDYLGLVVKRVNMLNGAGFGETFVSQLLATMFDPTIGKCKGYAVLELADYCSEVSLLAKDNQVVIESRDRESSQNNPNPYLAFAEKLQLELRQIEEVLDVIPDEELKARMIDTIQDVRTNRWNEFLEAMLEGGSRSAGEELQAIRNRIKELMKGNDGKS